MNMESWIEFGKGPLFRLCFALMLLGLGRAVFLSVYGTVESYRRSADRIVPWGDVIKRTLSWLFPIKRLGSKRPVYSVLSVVFHAGLILVPLFYAAHTQLWERSVGFAWFAIPDGWADWLTLLAVAAGLMLFLMRVAYQPARAISRKQDFLWPLLLIVPLFTGWLCVHGELGAKTYGWFMLTHIYTADLVMLLVPFTKVAHCLLAPLSHTVTAVGWKFPAEAGRQAAATLGYADKPSWVNKAR